MIHEPHEKEFRVIQKSIAQTIRNNCIVRPPTPMKGKAPGSIYHSIYQLARAGGGDFLYDVARAYLYLTRNLPPHQLAGRMWSSMPILAAISVLTNRHVFYIRRERKDYGPMNDIEGTIYPDLPVLLVDDLANSTESFAFCQEYLRVRDIPVLDQCFAIMNKKYVKEVGFPWDKFSQQEILYIVQKDMVHAEPIKPVYK